MFRAAVLTVSDSRSAGTAEDRSGPAACDALRTAGIDVGLQEIIPDDREAIRMRLASLVDRFDLVVTSGGTGISDRDVTPEAAAAVIERPLPGFGEIMRVRTFDKTPLSVISRSGAGIAGRTLIVSLPGSPRGVTECLEVLMPAIRHALTVLARQRVDCQAEAAASRGNTA